MDVSQNPYPVKPTGFLIGALLACGLYGAHTSQIYVYFSTFSSDSWRTKLLVLWVYTLSSLQIIIIAASAWKYYVWGVSNPNIWGEFWWPLSVQDGLIPLMAFTAQLFFGYRAWRLNGRRRWMAVIFSVLPVFTMMFGIGLAVTARIWSDDPWVSAYDFGQRQIGVPSQAVAIAWMGLSAFTDGTLTAALVYRFMKARRTSVFDSTHSMAARLIALTLETVLLTHLVGGVMCIIFLASPPAHRTDQDIFWVLLEIVTELYALSILFTINARAKFRRAFGPQSEATEPPIPLSDKILPADQSAIDMQVEGYQGSSPFGVAPYKVGLHHASATDSSTKDSSMVETPNEIPLPVLYVNEGSSGGFASLGSGNSSAESARPVWSAPKQ